MRTSPKRDGFSLMELLIVMLVLVVLITIALVTYWRTRDRSALAALQADLKNAAIQQESYYAVYSRYAASAGLMTDYTSSPGVVLEITFTAQDGWAGITRHQAVTSICGLRIGNAPVQTGNPAMEQGIIVCD